MTMEAPFQPPSAKVYSVIRSRTHVTIPESYASVKSVKDLGREGYCDPQDPCCVNKDPEVFQHQSLVRLQSRKQCIPKNPLHFEYTILHRLKLKNRLQMASERQLNPDLTDEEYQILLEQEKAATESAAVQITKPTANSSEEYFAEHPEVLPPSVGVIDGEELQKTLEGLTSMALAHEIALNKDFKLVKPGRIAESEMIAKYAEEGIEFANQVEPVSKEVRLTEEAKERYWLMVDHVLLTKSGKEAKNTVLDLMNTLKTMLKGTMLPNNLRMKMKIDHVMDLHKIEKEIDRDTFEIRMYMEFILNTLSVLCCPLHDAEILEIRNIEVPSRQIRECIELMEHMNLDMANFIISQSRKHVLQNCVLYERNNFANYIDTVYKSGKDPLRVIRNWIMRHTIPERGFSETMARCFAELLEGKKNTELMPETLTLDWHRLPQIQNEITKIILIGTVVAAVHEYSHWLLLGSVNDIDDFESNQIATLKSLRLLSKLREELYAVAENVDISDENKLLETLENCCNRATSLVNFHLASETCEGLTPEQQEQITSLIFSLSNPSHSSRLELFNRVKEWFINTATEDGKRKVEAPSTLHTIGALIIVPITEMMRLCMYNRSVFDVLYREIYDGKCPPPSVFPPKPKVKAASATVILDANKYEELEGESLPILDEGIVNLVRKLKEFSARTMVYRTSHIDPRIKPMFEADGNLIIPPEMQPEYRPKEMSAIELKHYDDYLLSHEPTLKEDYEGMYVFNVGDPDWMFGYTTEQLLKLMERENLINANKLRRIKERLEQEVLENRIIDNLPIFKKVWREEVGTLQKEFCRLQRIILKGPTPLPTGASDEPLAKRVFRGACELKPPPKEDTPMFTKKGERIIYSKLRDSTFDSSADKLNHSQVDDDLEGLEVYIAVESAKEDSGKPDGTGKKHSHHSDHKHSYMEDKVKPETPMELLSRNISIGIERGRTTRLAVGGLRIEIQEENSRLPLTKGMRKPNPHPAKFVPRTNFYPGGRDDAAKMFELPSEKLKHRNLMYSNKSVPLSELSIFQERKPRPITPRRQLRDVYVGPPPKNNADENTKRVSDQFQFLANAPVRKSAPSIGNHSRDSLDSLQTVLGSLQDERPKRKSQHPQLDSPGLPPVVEAIEELDKDKAHSEEEEDDVGLNSGKIRFEIPAPQEHVKDPAVKAKIRARRPTSVRTTRFSVPHFNQDDLSQKMKGRRATSVNSVRTIKAQRFDALPHKPQQDRRVSIKIRERRPTPMLRISPIFANLRRSSAMKKGNNQLGQTLSVVPGGHYQAMISPMNKSRLLSGRSKQIMQRNKVPEPHEGAQELKKSNIPKGNHPNNSQPTEPGLAVLSLDSTTGSRNELDAVGKPEDLPDDEPGVGLMRIRKRRNIGRVLTPPFSRNERSNSMTVLDFRSSMFYKRNKSTAPQQRKSIRDKNRQLIGLINKSDFKMNEWNGTGAEKVKFEEKE